jgi:flagellar biosynthesis/type III secretory pathway chaperone
MEPNVKYTPERRNSAALAGAIRFEHDPFEEDTYGDEATIDLSDATRVDVESVIALTARLAQVLAEEADLLADMRVRDIESLQKEKLQLLDALEAQKRFLDRNPGVLSDLTDEESLELAQIVEIFQTVMRENHRRLLIAREVNRTVLEAISEAVQDAGKSGFYDHKGLPERSGSSVSMSVNQTI